MRKVAVVGTRWFSNYDMVEKDLDRLLGQWDRFMIVSGGASGADSLAERYGRVRCLPITVFPANWHRHGKAAGPMRNTEIVAFCDCMVAFWDGKSPGTKNAIEQARAAGKRVWVRAI